MILANILKDTNYKSTQFNSEIIKSLEDRIVIRNINNKKIPYVVCSIREKEIKLVPEEAIRQLYITVLNKEFGYPFQEWN